MSRVRGPKLLALGAVARPSSSSQRAAGSEEAQLAATTPLQPRPRRPRRSSGHDPGRCRDDAVQLGGETVSPRGEPDPARLRHEAGGEGRHRHAHDGQPLGHPARVAVEGNGVDKDGQTVGNGRHLHGHREPEARQVHLLLPGRRPPRGRHGGHADGLVSREGEAAGPSRSPRPTRPLLGALDAGHNRKPGRSRGGRPAPDAAAPRRPPSPAEPAAGRLPRSAPRLFRLGGRVAVCWRQPTELASELVMNWFRLTSSRSAARASSACSECGIRSISRPL